MLSDPDVVSKAADDAADLIERAEVLAQAEREYGHALNRFREWKANDVQSDAQLELFVVVRNTLREAGVTAQGDRLGEKFRALEAEILKAKKQGFFCRLEPSFLRGPFDAYFNPDQTVQVGHGRFALRLQIQTLERTHPQVMQRLLQMFVDHRQEMLRIGSACIVCVPVRHVWNDGRKTYDHTGLQEEGPVIHGRDILQATRDAIRWGETLDQQQQESAVAKSEADQRLQQEAAEAEQRRIRMALTPEFRRELLEQSAQ